MLLQISKPNVKMTTWKFVLVSTDHLRDFCIQQVRYCTTIKLLIGSATMIYIHDTLHTIRIKATTNPIIIQLLVLSIGYAYDPDCMYINGSGRDYYEFYIQLNRCGTLGKNAINEKSRENPTVNRKSNQNNIQIQNILLFSVFANECLPCSTNVSISNCVRGFSAT